MAAERWIVIRNWDRFQHPDAARSSVPPWIKVWTELLSNEAYLDLTPTRRSLLLGLWLESARTRRKLPENTATLSRRLAQRVAKRDLEALNRAGFIEFSASNSASEPASEVARLEKRREEVPLTPATSAGDASRKPDEPEAPAGPTAVACLVCGAAVKIGYRCPACGSSPRTAGSTARKAHRATASSAVERAEAMTRNGGWRYPPEVFREELERFKLTDDECHRLEHLRADLERRLEGDEPAEARELF